MTGFWINLEQGVELVIKALEEAEGGEIFIPKIPSMKITDLAKAIEPECTFRFIGIRPGEKIHETLISEDESRQTKDFGDVYVILSSFFNSDALSEKYDHSPNVPDRFIYSSDNNSKWLTVKQLQKMFHPVDWKKDEEYSVR